MTLIDDDLYSLQDEFESNWRRESGSPSKRVVQFMMSRLKVDANSSRELLLALCEMDMERDWMWWRTYVAERVMLINKTIWSEAEISELINELEKTAKANDYDVAATELGISVDVIHSLEVVEIRSRAIWGDYPVSKHDERAENIKLPPPICATVASPNVIKFSTGIYGQLAFGRQRSHEPHLGRFGDRIAIAAHVDSKISRTQLSARMLSREYVLVENLSRMIPITLDDKHLIHGSERAVVSIPAKLRVADVEIELMESFDGTVPHQRTTL